MLVYLEDDVEYLVAIGKVINVQDNKMVQVLAIHDIDLGDKDKVIKNSSKAELSKLVIKPSFPSTYMEAISNV